MGEDITLERLSKLADIMNGSAKESGGIAENKLDFDMQFETPAIRTIKAAIPYIDRRYRRELGVMVKLIEIDKFLNEYKGVEIMTDRGRGVNMEMLRAVVPNLPAENRNIGEMVIKILEIRDIMQTIGAV